MNFNFNSSVCESHNHTVETKEDDDIQRYVTNLSMCASLIENIPSVLIVLFLGPWSDRSGRIVPMMFPLIGLALAISIYMLNYWFESWPAEYLLFASVPTGLCGGSASLFMSINRYLILISMLLAWNHEVPWDLVESCEVFSKQKGGIRKNCLGWFPILWDFRLFSTLFHKITIVCFLKEFSR